MISIIIPTYNHAIEIKKCLESILNQTCRDLEVVVVNDGSGDREELLEAIKNYKVKFQNRNIPFSFLEQENKGAPAARNLGFQNSKGEYIIFADADAVLKPGALKTMKNVLEKNPKASYVYSSFYWGKKLFRLEPFNSEKLKKEPYIHSISLIRRKDFPQGAWDESIKRFQDWDLWLTMLEEGKTGHWIKEPLFSIISTKGTMSTWLPSFVYKLLPILPSVKKYKEAKEIIKKKHNLD